MWCWKFLEILSRAECSSVNSCCRAQGGEIIERITQSTWSKMMSVHREWQETNPQTIMLFPTASFRSQNVEVYSLLSRRMCNVHPPDKAKQKMHSSEKATIDVYCYCRANFRLFHRCTAKQLAYVPSLPVCCGAHYTVTFTELSFWTHLG